MRNPSPAPRFLARAGVLLAVVLGLGVVYSCSLIVETSSQQCQQDSDCASVSGGFSKCNTMTNLCMQPDGGSSSSGSTSSSSGSTSSSSGAMSCDVDGGIDAGGCYNSSLAMCTDTDNAHLLNGCTTGCIPFDNKKVTLLDGGVLPGFPNPGPDGGM